MIEIDSGIIDAEILLERIKTAAEMKNIPKKFYGENPVNKLERINLVTVQESMIQIHQDLQKMQASWVIGEKPLASVHPVVGPLIVFCKKVYRKLTRWLFATYYQQQTEFNGAATKTIADMVQVQEMLIQLYGENERLEERNEN